MAYFQAMEVGLQLGLSKVQIKGDSLIVIRKLQGNRVDRLVIGGYVYNTKNLCTAFQICNFNHVRKQENPEAHILAIEGLKREEDTYLLHDVPSYAKWIIDEDRRHLGRFGISGQIPPR